ncbi:putative laccase-9 [Castanea sativa]|uniref:putative laccase-9 n=1 Tax=Castanea sativa TaxID=21020 RepID=UPI003F64BD52
MGSLGQRGSKGEIELRWYQGSFYWSRYKLILMNVRFESKSIIWAEILPVELINFTMKETNYRRLCSTKTVSAVNKNIPLDPPFWFTNGILFVNIHDRGKYGIIIHWHGIQQSRNSWSNGLEKIIKCPVPPNASFTQEIIFFIEEGTLWWHAHSDWSCATIHGAIIILPALGTTYSFPKPYAEETIFPGTTYRLPVNYGRPIYTHNQFHNECRTMFWNC